MFTGTLSPASNRATWSESYELTDSDTGEAISLASVDEITLEVRDPDSGSAVLSGTMTGGEISIIATGIFQWRFEASAMRGLNPKTYEIGCVIEQDGDEVQILIGHLPVLDGIVT